jgi:hypothetical protein
MPRVTFVGKRALVRVYPNATSSAYATLKFGSIFEVDRFGRKVAVHAVPSLAALAPAALTSGVRVAGAASYTWVKLRYGTSQLGLNLTAYSCALAAQQSIAQEQAARAGLVAAAQRAQLEALAAGGGGAVPAGAAAAGALPSGSLPPGYAALQGAGVLPGGVMPAAMGGPAAAAAYGGGGGAAAYYGGAPYLPRSPVYSVAPTNVYGRRKRSLLQSYYAAQSRAPRPTSASWGPPAQTAAAAGYGPAPYLPAPTYGAAAGGGVGGGGGGGATFDPTTEGHLTLTFYTGFANATSFPYGKGNVITAPAGGLKWSLEASNWPFCSFDHALAVELDASTTKASTSMGQWTAGSEDAAAPAERAHAAQAAGRGGPASVMVNDAFAPPAARRRSLKQAGLGAYLSYMEDGGAAGAEGGSGRRKGLGASGAAAKVGYGATRVAKLLINDTAAVELGFPTYAFESPIGARAVNVSILLDSVLAPAPAGQPSAPVRFTLGLPYFQSIYYDPTVAFGDNTGMPISDLAQLPAGCTDIACSGAQAGAVRVKRAPGAGEKGAKNGAAAAGPSSSSGGRAALAAAVGGLLAVAAAGL